MEPGFYVLEKKLFLHRTIGDAFSSKGFLLIAREKR
jgi:hypothetical protein